MGLLRDLWLGTEQTETADFHDSSLASLIVATELQNAATVSTANKVASVYRGSQILSDLGAAMPWYAQKGGQYSGQRKVEIPERLEEQPAILLRPDPLLTRSEFIRQIILSLVFDGNAFILKSAFDSAGFPTICRVLPPGEVTVAWNSSQTLPVYQWRNMQLPRREVDHLALNRKPGDLRGIGPVWAGWETIAGQVAADRFARDLFERDGIPTGLLSHPAKLNQTEAKELLDAWQVGQAEGRKTGILSGGLSYDTVSLTPDQAQMLQSRSFGVAEIARFLGIPTHLLNAATGVAGASGGNLTYTNVQQVAIELVRMTLAPVYLSRIEEMASGWIPRGQSVAFDLHEFTRADEKNRFDAYAIGHEKWLTTDEIRELEGRPPSPELAAEKEARREMANAIQGDPTDEDA
jgi:HK97 family phage portal protein